MKNGNMKVVIVGTGYVGLTTAVSLAYLGHEVSCVDTNPDIIARLQNGQATIHEPGLERMMSLAWENLSFTTSLADSLAGAAVVIIAVGTPAKSNGDADLSSVEKVAEQIGMLLGAGIGPIIVTKSTVPIGSARRVRTVIDRQLSLRGVECSYHVASNPEFLREGAAITDTFYPDRIVVGTDDNAATDMLRKLYAPILNQTFAAVEEIVRPTENNLPVLVSTNPTSAELIKYAANSFLAMKISFINEMAGLAEKVGADIKEVTQGIGLDRRIGIRYLEAGLGWGGSCFAKDTHAIVYTAAQYGYPMELIQAAINVNKHQRFTVIEKLQSSLKVLRGATIGIMGLAFKPNTDDLRDAPAIAIIGKLLDLGARVRVYDPIAMGNFSRQYPELSVDCCSGLEELATGCDALVVVTEWPEFASVAWVKIGARMRQRTIVDGRNMLNKARLEKSGFHYQGVGR